MIWETNKKMSRFGCGVSDVLDVFRVFNVGHLCEMWLYFVIKLVHTSDHINKKVSSLFERNSETLLNALFRRRKGRDRERCSNTTILVYVSLCVCVLVMACDGLRCFAMLYHALDGFDACSVPNKCWFASRNSLICNEAETEPSITCAFTNTAIIIIVIFDQN